MLPFSEVFFFYKYNLSLDSHKNEWFSLDEWTRGAWWEMWPMAKLKPGRKGSCVTRQRWSDLIPGCRFLNLVRCQNLFGDLKTQARTQQFYRIRICRGGTWYGQIKRYPTLGILIRVLRNSAIGDGTLLSQAVMQWDHHFCYTMLALRKVDLKGLGRETGYHLWIYFNNAGDRYQGLESGRGSTDGEVD